MDPHRNYNPLFYRDSIVIDVRILKVIPVYRSREREEEEEEEEVETRYIVITPRLYKRRERTFGCVFSSLNILYRV